MTTFNSTMTDQPATTVQIPALTSLGIFTLRLAMGWIFLQSGVMKVLDPEWSATGYLLYAIPEGNPFVSFWASMGGNPLIDILNSWGALLIGISLLLGALIRWSAFWGSLMMLFYWASTLHGGIAQGFPTEFGWFVDQHIIYILALILLAGLGAGRLWGMDGWIAVRIPQLRIFTS